MKPAVPPKTMIQNAKPVPTLDLLFAGGSTLVFLALLASLAGSLSLYFL